MKKSSKKQFIKELDLKDRNKETNNRIKKKRKMELLMTYSISKYNCQLAIVHKWPKFTILTNYLAIDEVKVNQLWNYAQKYKLKPSNNVFQGNTDDQGNVLPNDPDHLRYQIPPPKDDMMDLKAIQTKMTLLILNFFNNITCKSKMAILFCKAGCVKQKLHTDYPLINGKQIKE
jgi:hypothetical protein